MIDRNFSDPITGPDHQGWKKTVRVSKKGNSEQATTPENPYRTSNVRNIIPQNSTAYAVIDTDTYREYNYVFPFFKYQSYNI